MKPLANVKIIFLVSFISIFSYSFILCTKFKSDKLKKAFKGSAGGGKLKYVLLWTPKDFAPFPLFKDGQKAFIERKCPEVDCYVTSNKKYFKGGLMKFDAIAFNGRNLRQINLPHKRYENQKYIYVNTEPAEKHPVCDSVYDTYFNWTYTYRLDSDILIPYLQIRNKNDEILGPKPDMQWMNTSIDGDLFDDIKARWQQKTNSAAWIVSNCRSLNNREKKVKILKKNLENSNLSLSIYGRCGTLTCPKVMQQLCWEWLERYYYFYLSFENSNCEDYVTEKLLNPLQHFMIPIVYGGANYSRFLPPGSYLDASKLSPKQLVAKMSKIITSFHEYLEYFKWQSAYKYTDAERDSVCALCSALQNKTMMDEKKTYKNFRKWWLPDYRKECKRVKQYYSSNTYKRKSHKHRRLPKHT